MKLSLLCAPLGLLAGIFLLAGFTEGAEQQASDGERGVFGGKEYLFLIYEWTSADRAWDLCATAGMEPFSIESKEEFEYLKIKIGEVPHNKRYWTKGKVETVAFWGKEINNRVESFAAGQQSLPASRCIYVDFKLNWIESKCDLSCHLICERRLQPPNNDIKTNPSPTVTKIEGT